MTQEDLAQRLDVSRQAVGKWVNDKGIPEVGKLVQISDLFGVSLDYLLKEDCEEKTVSEEKIVSEEKATPSSGYYVSQEMLDGYLSYGRQSVKQITGGISLFILSNIFPCFGQNNRILSLLYWLTMVAGLAVIIWYFFQVKQYPEIRTQYLTFDDTVYEAFCRQREQRRKKYTVMIIVGVVILFASPEIGLFFRNDFGQTARDVLEWIADTAWIALMIWAGMSMHNDSIVIKNAQQSPKNGSIKRYRWIYAALPVTAAAVLIGVITNAWNPYAPIVILFCCLLVTTCKLLIEGRND